ncbi:MAG: helix-turn-helix domain-containing protein [Rhodospirillaceae bacterium]|nr:helix-turn-helix domain-containing protein [Rhodospirillaceae bacterium]
MTSKLQSKRKAQKKGLEAYFQTNGQRVRPVDVAAIRAVTGLSQGHFAEACGISVHTLRNWEQGRRMPQGPAKALLLAIARDPVAVINALQGAD